MFSLICVWINGWVNNREAGDLRRNRGHYDVIVMNMCLLQHFGSLTTTSGQLFARNRPNPRYATIFGRTRVLIERVPWALVNLNNPWSVGAVYVPFVHRFYIVASHRVWSDDLIPTQRTHDAIITSLRRRNAIEHRFEVRMTLSLRRVPVGQSWFIRNS